MCWFYDGNIQSGLTESGFIEKPGIEPAAPGLQDIGLSPTSGRLLVGHFFVAFPKKHFVAFPWVVTSAGPGGFMIYVFIL